MVSDPITIICYKASQFENVIVDDCSLEVEGATIGPMIKWHLEELEFYVGRSAVFKCLLAIRRSDFVYIYHGEVGGRIVESRGEKYGFYLIFSPMVVIKR